ncbi:MAG TPA: Uma2 family endonuclease [Candidatus Binatia bacterium]|nr:Uma2 family endonuclease [Candidatus Binatia bacterium]
MLTTPPREGWPVVLQMRPIVELDDNQFFEFCQLNRDWRIERTAEGELVVMPPTGWKTGNYNLRISAALLAWADQDGTGVATDSSTGFDLPNGATRSPDAAWVRRSRLAALSEEQKARFLPLCPDFVIELRSPSDSLKILQDKLQEYMDNGAQLGWLLDPIDRRVYVYRPGVAVECLEDPATISGDPELPGFALDLGTIWAISL